MSTTGCVRSVWFTQPMREAYEIGVVSSPMGGDALASAELEATEDPAQDPTDSPGDSPTDSLAGATPTDGVDPLPAADEPAPASIAPQEQPARSPDQLQYFVSERLVLQRAVTSRDGAVAQGRIKVRRGRFVEQVVIPRKTPGVAVDWGDDWVAVSFEADSAIVFGLDDANGAVDTDVYHLRTRRDPQGGPLTVSMRGEQYEVRHGHHARLMVRRDSRTKRSRRRRVMRGRTLEDASE